MAVFTVDGRMGVLCCDVMRYGDHWYINSAGGNIANLIGFSAYTGGMIALDIEEITVLRDQMNDEEQAWLDTILASMDAD